MKASFNSRRAGKSYCQAMRAAAANARFGNRVGGKSRLADFSKVG